MIKWNWSTCYEWQPQEFFFKREKDKSWTVSESCNLYDFLKDNYNKSIWNLVCLHFTYPWFKTYHFAHLRCLSLGICHPPLHLPLKKHIFRKKNKHNKDKKVRTFYCLRTSLKTKRRNSIDQMSFLIKSDLIEHFFFFCFFFYRSLQLLFKPNQTQKNKISKSQKTNYQKYIFLLILVLHSLQPITKKAHTHHNFLFFIFYFNK